jgi:UrcA family protein
MIAKTALFAATLALSVPALASPNHSPASPQVAVSYRDLDLTSDAGSAALEARIRQAVKAVCPADPGLAELARHRIATQCFAETTVRTNQRVAEATGAARMARNGGRQVAAR